MSQTTLYLTCQTTPGIQLCTLKDKRNLEQVQNLHVRWHQALGCWIRGSTMYWSWWVYLHLNEGGFIWNYVYYSKSLMICVTFPLGFLLQGKFLTTLWWIPFNCISHLHELMLFSSLSSLTLFPYGTHFTLNRLLVHILSLSITLGHNVFVLVLLLRQL